MSDSGTDIYGLLGQMMESYGLGALMGRDAANNPTGWLADQITQGNDINEILVNLESTDVWKERFGAIVAQRAARARGENVRVMTAKEVVDTEESFRQKAYYYGMPPATYDSYKDFQDYIVRGITPEQFESSALRSWQRVNEAPAEVRQVFAEWYGPRGDAMLSAYFLDPEHVTANINRITDAAVAGGYARKYGFQLAQDRAYELAGRNVSDQALAEGFSRLQSQADIFRETASEQTDLQAGVEGLESEFALGGEGATKIQKRVQERTAAFGSGQQAGGALTRQGVYGLGSAE